eukprot:COSAG05_NODE_183_length_14758_cov_90.142506_7_plen_65_part_00
MAMRSPAGSAILIRAFHSSSASGFTSSQRDPVRILQNNAHQDEADLHHLITSTGDEPDNSDDEE